MWSSRSVRCAKSGSGSGTCGLRRPLVPSAKDQDLYDPVTHFGNRCGSLLSDSGPTGLRVISSEHDLGTCAAYLLSRLHGYCVSAFGVGHALGSRC